MVREHTFGLFLVLIPLGRQLSSDPETQVPNTVTNHLTSGIMKYITTTGRYTSGINLFEKLRTRDVEVSSLLARVLLAADEEVQAVRLLHDSLEDLPMDYALLDCEAAFCQSKNEGEMALECAKREVTAAPNEFSSWARLGEIYIDLERWNSALLTLNSCPMFTYQDKDSPRLPPPTRMRLPLLPESMLDEIDERLPKEGANQDWVHPSLLKLHAADYQGTFLKAYTLLTKIAASIGWDQLLKIRSDVFVMEEEYRAEHQQHHAQHSQNPSTVALHDTNSDAGTTLNGESGGNEEREFTKKAEEGQNGYGIEKPELTVASEIVKSGSEEVSSGNLKYSPGLNNSQPDTSQNTYSHFRNKRLCERWLDNLFMVLYEDLRLYTIWRTEMAQLRQQAVDYKKSATEWEILGDLAARLHHKDEAVEAYQHCLMIRFSPKAMCGILKLYERRKDTRGILSALIRLISWQYRWYSEVSNFYQRSCGITTAANFSQFSPELLYITRILIENEGALKVRSIIQSTNLPQHILDLTHHYCEVCATFRSSGSDG